MQLNELSKDLLISAKRRYLLVTKESVSFFELEQADTLVSMKELEDFYRDIDFDENDFGYIYEHSCYSY